MTEEEWFAAAQATARQPAFVAAVARCAAFDQAPEVLGQLMALHPRDQMLLHSLREHRHADIALSQYFAIGIQQYHMLAQLIEGLRSESASEIRVLDFACGFGRLLRLLRCGYPMLDIHAAEVQSDALAFCAREFGVAPIASSFDPQAFRPAQRFDVIWVASLFSHLPAGLFEDWLRVLVSCLGERGVLCFSARCLPPQAGDDGAGTADLAYSPASENAELDSRYYGTTHVNPAWVGRLVERDFGVGMRVRHAPRALANEQDLYFVSRHLPDRLPGKGSWGWLDVRAHTADGRLDLQGWAADLDALQPARVEIRLDGRVFEVTPAIDRPDVCEVFGNANGLTHAGWALTVPSPTTNWIEVGVVAANGDRNLLYAGVAR